MTNISSGKIFSYTDRILGEHLPITADVFLTNFCNNLCPYCTYRRWEFDSGARSMNYSSFVEYANRMLNLGVKGIILTGGGEPTLAPDFDKIVYWLKDNKIPFGINTNFNVYKEFSPTYLKVSLDGWDEDSYYDHRGVTNYTKVRENIFKYAKWKKENSPHTSLGIQVLATEVSDVINFYNANKDLPVDYISIRPMESTGGKYYKQLPADSKYNPEEIKCTIQRLSTLDSRVVMNFKWNMLDVQELSCTAQWAQLAVNEVGEVMYCCHKPYQIVGHIMDDDILKKKELVGTNMSMCDIPCRMTAPNHEVTEFLQRRKDVAFL